MANSTHFSLIVPVFNGLKLLDKGYYFRGLDNLIATARSNKISVCLGFQDYSQLNRDYGDKESKVIQNTVAIFSQER